MNLQSLQQKYSLPKLVKVSIERTPKGFFVKFPDYQGCFTFAEDPLELNHKITDALLTYFEVPRHIAEGLPILYVPKDHISSTENKPITTAFSFFAAISSLNANNPSIR